MISTSPIKPTHKAIQAYYEKLEGYGAHDVSHEMALRSAFQQLLEETGKPHQWTLIPEQPLKVRGKTVRPDGTFRDEWHLPVGYWEAKDTDDDLNAEIRTKTAKGYPLVNTIFEDTREAVLFQNGREVFRIPLSDRGKLADLLNAFYDHSKPDIEGFKQAVADFQERIPDLARALNERIVEAHTSNATFQAVFADFFDLCRQSLNPSLRREAVDEMLVQHLLTERLFRTVFDNPDFTKRNVIAVEIERVIEALASQSFSRADFLRKLDHFYKAIEDAARSLEDWSDKQHFLNSVYERFFQGYSVKVADTHGIVYTPQEVVDFMCASVEEVLKTEFGLGLGHKDVHILDPCTGTGNFIVNLMRRIPGKDRPRSGCGRDLMLIFAVVFGVLTPPTTLSRSQAMAAQVVSSSPEGITVQITVPFDRSMLDFETRLQQELNEAGTLATAEQLRRFGTDGSPIQVGSTTLYSKGPLSKEYQTPYGAVSIERHVYQSAQGGSTFCPLERDARIIVTSTPLFAKIVSSKYAEFGAARVRRDLQDNHGRCVSKCLVQDLADAVAAVALAKEESWSYSLPRWDDPPAAVSVGLDGSCMHLSEDGWRETMVGTLGFYDGDGQRLHTIYLGATPEYGKATFLERMTREVERARAELPAIRFIGIADGAQGNWDFLERHTEVQVVDFWHAAEYLGAVAAVLFRSQDGARRLWLEEMCHVLKHEVGGAGRVIRELRSKARSRPWAKESEEVSDAIRYFTNQHGAGRMNYAARVVVNDPIGSGVTEAACKVIVKQRLCGSGMRWKEEGAAAVLSLRCLTYTPERWDQFWSKVDQYGFPVAA